MVIDSVSLNEKFREVIRNVEGTEVARKELVKLSERMYEFNNKKQAQNFVDRNLNKLQMQELLVPIEGNRGGYSISFALQELLETAKDDEKRSLPRKEQTTFFLQQEESKAGAELQMLVAEIEAYLDLLAKYPSSQDVVNQLLHEAREKSTALYGKLNAVKKVIRLTEQESGELC
jgi:hypothetical protein